MDSSLSTVPPVWPSPRPDIFATGSPHAATSGATASVTLSPTPPVLCLSATGLTRSRMRSCSPEAAIASVSATVSARDMPRQRIAISSADIW